MDIGRISYIVARGRPGAAVKDRFRAVFGVDFRAFADSLGWFDVIAFDRWLDAGERSTLDVARERFGDAGADLCVELVSLLGEP